ncbi:protein-ADP-ribose hydrolase [Oceanirhabdus sp. W0125-5]|uniref:protein-ADP-ribose hydrolase n=1 Tax=Oceanirhabdus sp. W0125-5 TaxID=2999116 RepID=UPI0022F320EB|nr:protein-ADP-ribose hydrolase [Oceanirhabdus sp. W0125-5]WBW96708.1 protein-ADP-ribose hydrolase [Oceanirhabdus sp. W0125-5]
MNRECAVQFLIEELYEVNKLKIEIPEEYNRKRNLLRSLMNITSPIQLSKEFYRVQDELLTAELNDKIITHVDEIDTKFGEKILLWKGDITTLAVDAIVNAANSKLLGCFIPMHKCIDNAIHSASGMQLRNECYKIMESQGYDEHTGEAKITKGFNLPAKYVIHTVGPIITDKVTAFQEWQLASCYESCLESAKEIEDLKTIAFCCISTGEFCFPKKRAAEIAVRTVLNYLERKPHNLEKVVFNVFSEEDLNVYKNLFSKIEKNKKDY